MYVLSAYQLETMNKKIKIIKKKQKEILELESTITNEKFTRGVQEQIWVGRRVNKHDDRSTEMI